MGKLRSNKLIQFIAISSP